MKHNTLAWAAIAIATTTAACGGAPGAPKDDQVYYLHERGAIDRSYSWERYFPPLDREPTTKIPRRVGVAIFEGDVRFSRPVDWFLRTADYTAEQRQISYQSPRQFVFNIYERVDPPEATWKDILERYEADIEESGGQILAGRIPTATANGQGRSYLLKTGVDAKPQVLETFAHEVLVRTSNRVLLVQIVHSTDIETAIDEMAHALKSMRIY